MAFISIERNYEWSLREVNISEFVSDENETLTRPDRTPLLAPNSDLRDSREYRMKQVWGEWIYYKSE